jgi:hypothetical protein
MSSARSTSRSRRFDRSQLERWMTQSSSFASTMASSDRES